MSAYNQGGKKKNAGGCVSRVANAAQTVQNGRVEDVDMPRWCNQTGTAQPQSTTDILNCAITNGSVCGLRDQGGMRTRAQNKIGSQGLGSVIPANFQYCKTQ